MALFSVLEPDEYRWLLDYLRSPYFNRNAEVVSLAENLIALLRRNAPSSSYEPELIADWLAPGVAFNRKVFNHLTSKLLKLTEAFLAQRLYEQDEEKSGFYGLRAVGERGLDRSWRSRSRTIKKKLSIPTQINPDWLLTEFKLKREHHRWYARSGARTKDPYIQDTADALDRFYFAQKLQLSCTMVNEKLALGSPLKFRFLSGIATEELYELPNSQLARLYAEAYQLQTSKNDLDRLRGYLRLIRRHAGDLNQAETSELFNHAINYCVRQIRAGHRFFIQDLLDLYRDNLRAGYLFDRAGELSPWNYKNIVKLGLGVKAFDWATEVVEQYTKCLPQEAQSDAYHFSMADILYHREDYNRALDFLNRTEFSDIHYALGAKVMLIKIYYETQADEALYSLLFSFKIYLKRNRRIGQENKVAYHNFARFTEQLLKGGDREKLRGKIEAAKQLWDRSWLLGKL